MTFADAWSTVAAVRELPENFRTAAEYFYMAGRVKGIEDALKIEGKHDAPSIPL